MTDKALVIVDVQFDFLGGGALAVPYGDEVIPHIIERLDHPYKVVVLTRDAHPPDHCSFSADPLFVDKSWPVHCVDGHMGSEIAASLLEAVVKNGIEHFVVNKGRDPSVEQYSGFEGTTPDRWAEPPEPGTPGYFTTEVGMASVLEQVYGVYELDVVGLALDYCVKATAYDGIKRGFRVNVLLDCTRPVSYLTGVRAAVELDHVGVNVL